MIENRISRKHSRNKRTLPSRWRTSVQHPAITSTQGQEWGIWEIRYSRLWGIYTRSVRFTTNLFIQSGVWNKCALSHSELEGGGGGLKIHSFLCEWLVQRWLPKLPVCTLLMLCMNVWKREWLIDIMWIFFSLYGCHNTTLSKVVTFSELRKKFVDQNERTLIKQ